MSDSDDENYSFFGEPLEPLDEENLPKKRAISVEQQYATDSQGRRRFHGAFTGGFSAGYFNSVGTRDGWKPQQFKSSRTSKAQSQLHAQCPEDFMDEEDTSEFGIAPTGIRASSQYSIRGKGIKRKERSTVEESVIPGEPVLREILEPVHETIGITLLKKMGWKPGQGVGPRLTKKEKKRTSERIYGCALPNATETNEDDSDDDDDDDDDTVLFAPDDYEPFRSHPKDNYFGIGYTGLDRRAVLGHVNLFDDSSTFKLQDKNKKLSIRGQAFGVGAFEADDEDIYAREDMSNYDFSLGPEKQIKSRWASKLPINCRQTTIEGFTQGTNFLPAKKHFPAPEIPKDFKPTHIVRRSRFNSPPIEQVVNSNRSIRANERSIIIGEQKVHANIISEPSWLDKLKFDSFVHGGVEGASNNSSSKMAKVADVAADNGKSISKSREGQQQYEQDNYKEAQASDKLFETNQMPRSILTESTTQQQEAARMKMFGKLTRVVEPWQPSSIVCKRFNIPEPTTTAARSSNEIIKKISIFDSFAQASTSEKSPSLIPISDAEKNQHDEISTSSQTPEQVIDKFETTYGRVFLNKVNDSQEKGEEVEEEEKEQVSQCKNKKDLFKAIFLNSSSENSDDSGDEQMNNDDTLKSLLVEKPIAMASEVNQRRNNSPPRGIFAKVDLDNLIDSPGVLRGATQVARAKEKIEQENDELEEKQNIDLSEVVYGPALPTLSGDSENVSRSIISSVVTSKSSIKPSTSYEWVEKRKKPKKDKKKKHKHREKDKTKHKHKLKKKK